MTQSQKTGVIGGTIGATIGFTAWLIIMGISIKSPLIILMPIIWGLICVVGVIKLYNINPSRKFAIVGIGLLWLVVLNFILGNILYDKIPDTLGSISTGKEQFSLVKINIFLGLMALLGFYFLIKDILEKKNV